MVFPKPKAPITLKPETLNPSVRSCLTIEASHLAGVVSSYLSKQAPLNCKHRVITSKLRAIVNRREALQPKTLGDELLVHLESIQNNSVLPTDAAASFCPLRAL